MNIKKISKALALEVEGNDSLEVFSISPIDAPDANSILFVENPKKNKRVLDIAKAFLIPHQFKGSTDIKKGKAYFFSKEPKLSFITLLNLFNPYKDIPIEKEKISSKANIHSSVVVGFNCIIGRDAVLEEGVVLKGNNYLGAGVIVKKNSILEAGAVVTAGCIIGASCHIGPNASIGHQGFGYEATKKGAIKIPQIGKVVLEDQVDIGANSCIDRATLGETRIGFNTKIDNLVQIAHNVQIGPHSFIAGQAGIAGSSKLGKGVILAGKVGISDHVEIGDHVQIGAGSIVFSNKKIPSGEILFGIPATKYVEQMKLLIALKKLPQLIKHLKGKGK